MIRKHHNNGSNCLLPNGELLFDPARKVYLDSTEIGAINYWIGMILITVLGKKKYGYEYMVHLSMVLKLSSQPPIEKHRFLYYPNRLFLQDRIKVLHLAIKQHMFQTV